MLALEKKREKPKICSNERQQFQSTISKMFGIFHLSSQDIRSCSNFWTPSLCLQSTLNELIASVSMQNCISRNHLVDALLQQSSRIPFLGCEATMFGASLQKHHENIKTFIQALARTMAQNEVRCFIFYLVFFPLLFSL